LQEHIDRAIGIAGLFLSVIGTLSFFIGENYIPTFIVRIIVIITGIGIFLFLVFWPNIKGETVKKKLGKPCKIGVDRIQYYLSRRDLPLEALVKLARKEITFVSVSHEIVAPDKEDVIRQAIINKNIKVKVMVLDPNSTIISIKERIFGLGIFSQGEPNLKNSLKDRIKDSLQELNHLKTELPQECLCSAIFHIQKVLLCNPSSALDSCAVSKVTRFLRSVNVTYMYSDQ
jgi:hypothetical protein